MRLSDCLRLVPSFNAFDRGLRRDRPRKVRRLQETGWRCDGRTNERASDVRWEDEERGVDIAADGAMGLSGAAQQRQRPRPRDRPCPAGAAATGGRGAQCGGRIR